ncbi:hypothetical protein [Kingella oralis]|nr:hypothetical protein [Kingella oralis]
MPIPNPKNAAGRPIDLRRLFTSDGRRLPDGGNAWLHDGKQGSLKPA